MEPMEVYVIPVLVFLAVTMLGGAALDYVAARRNPVRSRLGKLEDSADLDGSPPKKGFAVGLLSKIGLLVASGGVSPRLSADLAKAGFHSKAGAGIYLGGKMLLLLLGLGGGAILLGQTKMEIVQKLVGTMTAGGILFFLPNIYVSMRRESRSGEVRNFLPDMVDLLEICVSGGMGLDMAWNAVSEEFRKVSPLLADEMALTNLELHLGADRATAMRHMAERTGAEDLASLVAVLVQTERFGTSVAQALKVFADNMRQLRSDRCEEEAEKMAIKLLMPLILFIFPVILIVAVGPAIIILMMVLG